MECYSKDQYYPALHAWKNEALVEKGEKIKWQRFNKRKTKDWVVSAAAVSWENKGGQFKFNKRAVRNKWILKNKDRDWLALLALFVRRWARLKSEWEAVPQGNSCLRYTTACHSDVSCDGIRAPSHSGRGEFQLWHTDMEIRILRNSHTTVHVMEHPSDHARSSEAITILFSQLIARLFLSSMFFSSFRASSA